MPGKWLSKVFLVAAVCILFAGGLFWFLRPSGLHRDHPDHQLTIRAPTDVQFTADGQLLAASSLVDGVRFWRVADWSLLRTLATPPVVSLSFAPDGQTLALATGAGVLLMQAADGQLVRQWDGGGDVAFSPDGQVLAAGGSDGVRLWRVNDGVLLRTLQGARGDLAWTRDGKLLATSDARALGVQLWNTADGQRLQVVNAHSLALAFSADDKVLAAPEIPDDQSIHLWNIQDASSVGRLPDTRGQIHGLAFHPSRRILASAAPAGVRLWSLDDNTVLETLDGVSDEVGFSPNGQVLAATGKDAVRVWFIR